MDQPTEKRLYNPLISDFSYTWFDDANEAHVLTLRAMEITTLPYSQGVFMEKHLIDEILNLRGVKTNREDDYKNIQKEVEA